MANEQQDIIPGLPKSIAQNCLARVPRGLYWRLRLVSLTWNQALQPETIYPVRNAENISEAWLYVLLEGSNCFHALDPVLMMWRQLPRIPSDDVFSMGDKECFVAGRQLLVVGPTLQLPKIEPIIWRYNLDNNAWKVAPPMRVPRCLYASGSNKGLAYVAGGARFGSRVALADAEMFSSERNQWTTLPKMSKPRKECSGFVMDGCFYVIGGCNDKDEPLTSGEVYNPSTRRWNVVDELWPEARLQGGTLAPPLVAVVNDELYAWDHPNGVLKKYNKILNRWGVLDAAPGRAANPASHGFGLGFKGVGDELWLIGGSNPDVPYIDACKPDPGSGRLRWRRVATTWNGHSFVYNCAVMKA